MVTVPPLLCETLPEFTDTPHTTPIPDKSLALMARVRKMGNVEAFIENGEVGVDKMGEVCIIC